MASPWMKKKYFMKTRTTVLINNKLSKSILFSTLIFHLALTGFGQDVEEKSVISRTGALKVFMDCRCDINYIRQEIPFINYVRDVTEAQVYILVTNQNTASGGSQYTFSYQGLGEFKGINDTLVLTTFPDETSATIREGQVNVLKMGLMRYISHTPVRKDIQIRFTEGLEPEEVTDKWNNWVIELQTSPRFNAEESYSALNLFNSVNVSKVTPDIKLEIDFNHSFNRQKYREGDEENTYLRQSESVNVLFVRSLGEHWSAGLTWGLGGSTQANYNSNHEVMPAIEYDLFPYSKATHKQLRFLYSAGYQGSNYIDTTIFNLTNEHRLKHILRIGYQVQEKWGSVNISLSGSNYLHDFSKNSIEVDGFIRIRVFKGLSMSVNGQAGYINDRLNQRKGELSEAERLLRLKQQATSFEVGASLSINYTFGSIYSNVVNPRFNRY